MNARQPTAHDRCTECGDAIDPRNYDRTRTGFRCEPCSDEAHEYSHAAHDQDAQA